MFGIVFMIHLTVLQLLTLDGKDYLANVKIGSRSL